MNPRVQDGNLSGNLSTNLSTNSSANLSTNFLTVGEVAGLLKISIQAVQKNCKKGKYETTTMRGIGGTRYMINLSSLPSEIQSDYRTQHNLIPDPAAAVAHTPIVSRRDDITEEMIRAVNAVKGGKRAEDIAKAYGVDISTIYRWRVRVNASTVENRSYVLAKDMSVVIPKLKKIDTEVFIYGLMAYVDDPKAGIKGSYTAACQYAAERKLRIADYTAYWRAFGKTIPPELAEYILRGERGFEKNIVPKMRREWLKVPGYTVLCCDQKVFDYDVFDDNTGEIMHPEGFFIMDCTSRYICGFAIEAGSYNSYTVMNALRMALEFGIPEKIQTDWGRPELSKNVAALRERINGDFKHLPQLAGDLERYTKIMNASEFKAEYGNMPAESGDEETMKHVKAGVRKPWHKPIENFMNILDGILRDMRLPGYNKRSTDAWRDDVLSSQLKQDHKNERLLTMAEFAKAVIKGVQIYNNRAMSLKELNGGKIIPSEVFARELNKVNRPRLDDVTLDYICMPRHLRQVRQSVVSVTVRKGDVRSYHCRELIRYNNQKIWVSVDPYDVDAPAVLTTEKGEHIGVAPVWGMVNPLDNSAMGRIGQMNKQLKDLVRNGAKEIKAGLGYINTPVSLTKTTARARKAKAETVNLQEYKTNKKKADLLLIKKAAERQ